MLETKTARLVWCSVWAAISGVVGGMAFHHPEPAELHPVLRGTLTCLCMFMSIFALTAAFIIVDEWIGAGKVGRKNGRDS